MRPNCYQMLQNIGPDEGLFNNEVNGKSYYFYIEWLKKMDNWSKSVDLPDGYVRQTIYWLFLDDTPIGIGKLRHDLTDDMIKFGGNVGYAIDKRYRGKGYGKQLIMLLIDKAKKMGIEKLVATVENNNIPSNKVMVSCGGDVIYEDANRRSYVLYKSEHRETI